MGNSEQSTETVGASAYSRSAIGYAGIAEVLQRLDMPVVKSRYDSLGKLTPGSVLVIAEPLPGAKTEETMRTLLKADTVLLILPEMDRPAKQRQAQLDQRGDPAGSLHRRVVTSFGRAERTCWTSTKQAGTTNALNSTPQPKRQFA